MPENTKRVKTLDSENVSSHNSSDYYSANSRDYFSPNEFDKESKRLITRYNHYEKKYLEKLRKLQRSKSRWRQNYQPNMDSELDTLKDIIVAHQKKRVSIPINEEILGKIHELNERRNKLEEQQREKYKKRQQRLKYLNKSDQESSKRIEQENIEFYKRNPKSKPTWLNSNDNSRNSRTTPPRPKSSSNYLMPTPKNLSVYALLIEKWNAIIKECNDDNSLKTAKKRMNLAFHPDKTASTRKNKEWSFKIRLGATHTRDAGELFKLFTEMFKIRSSEIKKTAKEKKKKKTKRKKTKRKKTKKKNKR